MGFEQGSQVRVVLYHHCTKKQRIRQNDYALSRLGFPYESESIFPQKLMDLAFYLGIHYNTRGAPMSTLSLVRLMVTVPHMTNGIKSSWVVPLRLCP